MTNMSRQLSLPILALLLALSSGVSTGFAQDAMATDAMASDPMAMMSDDDLAQCLVQAGAITFPEVMKIATDACHGLHDGHMGGDAMAGDAMAPAK